MKKHHPVCSFLPPQRRTRASLRARMARHCFLEVVRHMNDRLGHRTRCHVRCNESYLIQPFQRQPSQDLAFVDDPTISCDFAEILSQCFLQKRSICAVLMLVKLQLFPQTLGHRIDTSGVCSHCLSLRSVSLWLQSKYSTVEEAWRRCRCSCRNLRSENLLIRNLTPVHRNQRTNQQLSIAVR